MNRFPLDIEHCIYQIYFRTHILEELRRLYKRNVVHQLFELCDSTRGAIEIDCIIPSSRRMRIKIKKFYKLHSKHSNRLCIDKYLEWHQFYLYAYKTSIEKLEKIKKDVCEEFSLEENYHLIHL